MHKIEAFEMKCIRKIVRVSWTQTKTIEWVLEQNEVWSLWSKGGYWHASVMWMKEIAWRKRSCRALFREQEIKGDQRCNGQTTWENGLRCRLKNYWGRQRTEGDWIDLSMKRPTLGTRVIKDKTSIQFKHHSADDLWVLYFRWIFVVTWLNAVALS